MAGRAYKKTLPFSRYPPLKLGIFSARGRPATRRAPDTDFSGGPQRRRGQLRAPIQVLRVELVKSSSASRRTCEKTHQSLRTTVGLFRPTATDRRSPRPYCSERLLSAVDLRNYNRYRADSQLNRKVRLFSTSWKENRLPNLSVFRERRR